MPGGLVAALSSVEGHQFGAPNGFGPMTWLPLEGLDGYGCGQTGDGCERQWRDTVFRDFETRGHLAEKHNVLEPGAAPLEDRYETVVGSAWTSSLVFDAAQAAGAGGVRRAPPSPVLPRQKR
jgi:neutral trehalase